MASAITVVIGIFLATVGAHHLIETRVAHALDCRLAATGTVKAEVGLLGSLPALVTGHVGDVHVQAPGISLGRYVGRFDGHFTNLRTTQSPLFHTKSQVTTDGGTATVTLAYNQIELQLGNATSVGADKGQLIVHVDLTGRHLVVRVAVSYRSGAIRIAPQAVQIGAKTVPVRLLRPLLEQQSPELARQLEPRVLPIRLQKLAHSLTISGVRAANDGLRFTIILNPGKLGPQNQCK